MKPSAFLILFLFGNLANAGQEATAEVPKDSRTKICWIGGFGTYIPETEKCIDTQAKCEAMGGRWGGVVIGRGRSHGCNLPTKDAGKKCSDSSQCESGCIAHDDSNKNCSCYEWQRYPKGHPLRYCSFKGIVYGPHVD